MYRSERHHHPHPFLSPDMPCHTGRMRFFSGFQTCVPFRSGRCVSDPYMGRKRGRGRQCIEAGKRPPPPRPFTIIPMRVVSTKKAHRRRWRNGERATCSGWHFPPPSSVDPVEERAWSRTRSIAGPSALLHSGILWIFFTPLPTSPALSFPAAVAHDGWVWYSISSLPPASRSRRCTGRWFDSCRPLLFLAVPARGQAAALRVYAVSCQGRKPCRPCVFPNSFSFDWICGRENACQPISLPLLLRGRHQTGEGLGILPSRLRAPRVVPPVWIVHGRIESPAFFK